jgi:transposase-like protein
MNTEQYNPKTLIEAVRYFSDLDTCHGYMAKVKWPDGKITCPKCGGDAIGIIASRRMLQCKAKTCRKQFSAKVGTIFEDSPLPLSSWFVAVWSVANAKNGISSCELARALGTTQKTAWFMLHRVRLAMKTGTFRKMSGTTESDETYIGGLAKNMHKSRRDRVITGTGGVNKSIVHGLLERHTDKASRVKAKVIPNAKKGTVQAEVRAHVEPGSEVFTDALRSYNGLNDQYVHDIIDHAEAYVRGKVHTNGLENFWSLLKRTIRGTYIHLAPEHLDRYLDEQTTRFNERDGNDGDRFAETMKRVTGRRVTYAELTGKATA